MSVKKNAEYGYKWGGEHLEQANEEKDVGVLIYRTLKTTLQRAKVASKAISLSSNTRVV